MTGHPDLLRIQAALRGDPAAIAGLIEELAPVVQRRVARALLRTGLARSRELRPDVEDLCQEVFSQLFASGGRVLATWQPERGLSLAAFVGLVAQRQVSSLLRRRQDNPLSTKATDPGVLDLRSSEAEGQDAQRKTEAAQLLEQLALRLRERLSTAGLEMFYRLYVWEQSVEEVGKETGQSPESIYQWRSRIRKAALEVERELVAEVASGRPTQQERVG